MQQTAEFELCQQLPHDKNRVLNGSLRRGAICHFDIQKCVPALGPCYFGSGTSRLSHSTCFSIPRCKCSINTRWHGRNFPLHQSVGLYPLVPCRKKRLTSLGYRSAMLIYPLLCLIPSINQYNQPFYGKLITNFLLV